MNNNLSLFHLFPKPKNDIQSWQKMKINALQSEDINFLFATGSLTKHKSGLGMYYFDIPQIKIQLPDVSMPKHPDYDCSKKAFVIFAPKMPQYYLKEHIVNADETVMSSRNKMKALIRSHQNIAENPNKILPKYISESLVNTLKEDIIYLSRNLQRIRLEEKSKGARRACYLANKGCYFISIFTKEYQYPPKGF